MSLRPLVWTLGFVVASLPATTLAETDARCQRTDCSYRFDDDPLAAPGLSVYEQWLQQRGSVGRVLLIRPRLSFVPELLKTIQEI